MDKKKNPTDRLIPEIQGRERGNKNISNVGLGHVTLTIYINFLSPFPRMLHMKFGFDWPCGFKGEDVSLLWKYTCI